MADKKITQLTSLLATDLSREDLLVIVDNGDIPITKNISVGDLMSGVKYNLTSATQNTITEIVPFKSLATASITSTVTSSIRAGEFIVNAISGAANTSYQYGIVVRSGLLQNSTTNATVKLEHAAAKFAINLNNATSALTNTHALILEVANTTYDRVTNVQSFIAFGDLSSNSTTAQTLYLFDVGKNGSANVSTDSTATNVSTLFSNTSIGSLTDITHKLRIRVNGEDFYILLANTAGVL